MNTCNTCFCGEMRKIPCLLLMVKSNVVELIHGDLQIFLLANSIAVDIQPCLYEETGNYFKYFQGWQLHQN